MPTVRRIWDGREWRTEETYNWIPIEAWERIAGALNNTGESSQDIAQSGSTPSPGVLPEESGISYRTELMNRARQAVLDVANQPRTSDGADRSLQECFEHRQGARSPQPETGEISDAGETWIRYAQAVGIYGFAGPHHGGIHGLAEGAGADPEDAPAIKPIRRNIPG